MCSGAVASKIMSKYGWEEGQGETPLCSIKWWSLSLLFAYFLNFCLYCTQSVFTQQHSHYAVVNIKLMNIFVLGLGKTSQGISTALSVEKTSKRGGKIVNASADIGKNIPLCTV